MIQLLYENEDIWVYDKPSNVSVLRDRSGDADLWSELKKGQKPFLVHRLDKGTSGVWIVAKTSAAQARITRAFANRQVTKFYVALVDGIAPKETHHIDLPLTKGRKSRYRIAGQRDAIRVSNRTYTVAQDREGVAARTSFRTLISTVNRSLVLIHPKTGRTHQIRVHLAWLGFPIVGDALYNRAHTHSPGMQERLHLHAHYLRLPELPPFTASLPDNFTT